MSSFGAGRAGRPKFYKGSAQDTAWNHDLLWKARVTSENGLIGIKHHENVPSHYTNTVGPAGAIDASRVRNVWSVRRCSRNCFSWHCRRIGFDFVVVLFFLSAAPHCERPRKNCRTASHAARRAGEDTGNGRKVEPNFGNCSFAEAF